MNGIAAFFARVSNAFYKATPNKGETLGTANLTDVAYILGTLVVVLYIVVDTVALILR